MAATEIIYYLSNAMHSSIVRCLVSGVGWPMSDTLLCVCALSWSQFLTDFNEIWHRRLEPDRKGPFRWGWKSTLTKGIPIFTPLYPKLAHT